MSGMETGAVLLTGGTCVLPDGPARVDLLLRDGVIAAIGEGLDAKGAEQVDCVGCIILPGAIDTHTHMDLPVSGTVTADDFESGTRAALLGGTTMLIDFATQDRGGTLREGYDTWRARMAKGPLACHVGLHMAATEWNDAISHEVDEMTALGITSYKLYMAYPALMVEDDAIYAALKRVKEAGGIIGFHCENGRLVTAMTAEQRAAGQMDPQAHPLSRPPAVEAEAIARLLRIAQLADAPVNIVHLSSREGMEAVRQTKKPGQRVFIETCPQYLLLDDSLYARADGAKFVCSPPLRRAQDMAALWEALAAGEIETVGTDHCSFRYADQKLAGRDDFSKIPNGLPGVEHRLALMMTEGVGKGRLSLLRLAQVLCEDPARLFGVYPQKGVLRTGSDADITVWDPQRAHTITVAEQMQHVDYTPYEGMPVDGGVRDVWLGGGAAVRNGALVNGKLGRYVPRGKPEV